jgi:hypothetical protein
MRDSIQNRSGAKQRYKRSANGRMEKNRESFVIR